jgi:hypothetical protein
MTSFCCTEDKLLEVSVGPHARENAVVSVPCRHCACAGTHTLEETDLEGHVLGRLPAQCQVEAEDAPSGTLTFLLPSLPAGERRRYRVVGDGEEFSEGVTLTSHRGQMDFQIRGEPFTSYVYAPEVARPYYYPVLGPGGVPVTNFAPADHPHHKSLWVAHGAVNECDNWSELEGHSRSVNQDCVIAAQGPVYAELCAVNDWQTPQGHSLLLEVTRMRVYNLAGAARLMEWRIELTAGFEGAFFGDTKEAGLLSVRVAESMEVPNGGRIASAYGAVGEAECWGQPAPWVDYSGPVGDATLGVALLDHPANFRYPTPWHVRDYGLFTANCWGLHEFAADWSVRGDYALPPGQTLSFRFRVYLHEGDETQGGVAGQWHNFAHPPAEAE